jgi:hypothetical protein
MRAAISLLVSSLAFGSLAFDSQAMANRLSHLLPSSSDSQQLLSMRPKHKSNEPENPTPHRGSGRRNFIESVGNNYPVI